MELFITVLLYILIVVLSSLLYFGIGVLVFTCVYDDEIEPIWLLIWPILVACYITISLYEMIVEYIVKHKKGKENE